MESSKTHCGHADMGFLTKKFLPAIQTAICRQKRQKLQKRQKRQIFQYIICIICTKLLKLVQRTIEPSKQIMFQSMTSWRIHISRNV